MLLFYGSFSALPGFLGLDGVFGLGAFWVAELGFLFCGGADSAGDRPGGFRDPLLANGIS